MKILSLKALNINSLKGKTEINFLELTKESALFAITGATGSGKSTLLDIISCALYGRTARLKNPNDLMSRHTGEAYCEVEFEIKSKIYRSSWSQKRARKKHDGKFQSAIMELSNASSGDIIEKGLREVPKHIESLSGLDFGRFTQSMMLAQGSFDAFLKADEKERSALLEKITGTQIYAEISKAIHVKYSEYQKEIQMQSVSLESISLLDEKVLEEKNKNLSLSKAKKRESDKQIKELLTALNWVQTLATLSDESQKYQKEFSKISKEKEDKKEDFLQLELANKALHVRAVYDAKKQLEKSLHVSTSNLEKLRKECIKLSDDIAQQTQSYILVFEEMQEAEKVFDTQNEKLKNARHIQTQENEVAKNISALLRQLKIKEAEGKKLRLHVSTLNESFKQLEDELTCKKNYLQEHSSDEKLLLNLSAIEQILKQFHDEKASVKTLKNEIVTIEKMLKIKEDILKTLQKEIEILVLTCKTKEQEILLQKYEEDREKLEEGEACFLCGATEHPYIQNHPDYTTDDTQNSVDELQISRELKKNREQEYDALNIEILNLNTKKEFLAQNSKLLDKKLEQLMQSLKSYSDGFSVETLDKHYKVLLERKKAYLKTQDTLEVLEKNSLTCKLDSKESETQLLSLKTDILSHKEKLSEAEIRVKNLQEERISVLNVANLESYEKEISLTCKLKQKAEQEAKSKGDITQTKYEQLSKQEKILKQNIIEDKKSLDEVAQKLQEQLKENHFENEAGLVDACLSHEAYEKLSLTCKSIQEQYTQLKILNIEIQKRLQLHMQEPKSDKSKEVLEEELKELQSEADSLQLCIGHDEKELELNFQNEAKYKEKIALLQKKKDAFKVWAKLQELIGSADGTKFKKYAQGITLDQLINLANQQLQVLSSRYTLLRSSEEKQLLELEVMDAFQGNVCRSVSTLSGGESFIVSLALALGLSKLASQKIAIDSLFLDEGFGTLDEESLETALNALNLLQSSGKMVGVISHVEALKERIPLQIKVIANGDGTSYIELVE